MAHKKKKKIGLSVCDVETFNEIKSLKFDFYKLLSIAINNYDLIDELKKTNKTIYISTGFNSSLEKIKNVLIILKITKKLFYFIHRWWINTANSILRKFLF